MKKFTQKLLALFLSVLLAAGSLAIPVWAEKDGGSASDSQASDKYYVEGEAIAVMKSDIAKTFSSRAKKSSGFGKDITVEKTWSFAGAEQTETASENSAAESTEQLQIASFSSNKLTTGELIAQLEKNENVEYAIPNYIKRASALTNDTYSEYQWALENSGQNGGKVNADVNPEELWKKNANSNKENVIAVVDTGVDYNHPDLKDNMWKNPYGAKLLGKCGYDFTDTIKDHSPYDDDGHGTHVAGIIAASADNAAGISGINKKGVKIMALKFLDANGEGNTASVISAYEYIYYAMQLGTNVTAINNSWGGYGDEEELELFDMLFDLLGEAGALSIVAAGNDGVEVGAKDDLGLGFFDEETIYDSPACCKSNYAVKVAATSENGTLASFSSYGKKYIDVAAPGTDILSSVSYNCFNPTIYSDEQRSLLCSQYQGYENAAENSFGMPELLKEYTDEYGKTVSRDISASVSSEKYFGSGAQGKSLNIKTGAPGDETNGGAADIFSVPYKLSDADKKYSYSFMITGTNGAEISCYDFPASVKVTPKLLEDEMPVADFYFDETDDSWYHIFYDTDPAEEMFYEKSTERKLVFLVKTIEKTSDISIDDFAISSQDANYDDFGKYDFYSGTSMATPYVTGAAAMLALAYPDASPIELSNMIVNTGTADASLAEKVVSGKTLSLSDTASAPPVIESVNYNKDGNVSIKGYFGGNTQVSVNSVKVTPVKSALREIIIPDNGYNTKEINIEVSNSHGSFSGKYLLVNKKAFSRCGGIEYTGKDVFMLPAGETVYTLSPDGVIGCIEGGAETVKNVRTYEYDAYYSEIDYESVFGDFAENGFEITAAVYMNGSIYFNARCPITTAMGTVIGYVSAFCSADIEKEKCTALCELPNDMLEGATLAVYKGNIYSIGGYDSSEGAFSKSVYKYDASKYTFTETSFNLPQGRAYGKAIQYENTLVYAYGAEASGNMPAILTFNGTSWSEAVKIANCSDSTVHEFYDGSEAKLYEGSVGIAQGGIFCCGSFINGVGDSFVYNVSSKKIIPSNYSFSDTYGDEPLVGTTTLNSFVGLAFDEYGYCTAYDIPLKTSYAEVICDYPDNCEIDIGYSSYYCYGDKVTAVVYPDSGYAVSAITANGKNCARSGNKADVVINGETFISAKVKYVAPQKVTSLKVSSSTSTGYTLSWAQAKRSNNVPVSGYVVQQYKNKKWVNVKVIKGASTTSYKIAKQSSGKNYYRVRAYSVYENKNYYGAYSTMLTVYVPPKQSISSVSSGRKSFTVKYKKDASASGYQIQYSTSSKFTSAKTVKVGNKTVSKSISGLQAKKKYYVRVRSYKIVNNKYIWGAWSSAKSVKTK